ncbi:hypothetical protein FA420_04335 [Pseudomonas aeruginosa]|nr:hypothetical protein [Pseudomonas aeruginosa]
MSGGAIYRLLLPSEKTGTQDYWNKHIAILRNAVEGLPYHLGTLSALQLERLVFFKDAPSRSNGLLLLQMTATTWQIVRTLADITGDERAWFKGRVRDHQLPVYDEARAFFDQMHEVFEIASFLRHPAANLMAYDWVFRSTWPQDKADFIEQAAHTLHSVVNLAVNEFALGAGWVGDTTKKMLHDTAMQQWAALCLVANES